MTESLEKLLIVGAGGFGRTVAEVVLRQRQYELVGFIDDVRAIGEELFGVPVIGRTDQIEGANLPAPNAIVAIGDNWVRARLWQVLVSRHIEPVCVIHDRAVIAESASLGRGTVVMGGAVVGCEAQVGAGAIVNAGATLDHHVVVEAFGHIGAGSVLAGSTKVGERAWLRAGCVLGYRSEVGVDRIVPPGTAMGE